jgi:uncharacterized protein YjeT (DUF2065 family)
MWDDFLRAFALMLVFEGMLPFVAPDRWRNLLQVIGQLDDKVIRRIGLASMVAGMGLLYWVKSGL